MVGSRAHETNGQPTCRFCAAPLELSVVDLGMSPPCQSFVPPERVREMEPFYPLHCSACERCFLVQLEVFVAAGGHLHGVRVLLRLLDLVGGPRPRLRRDDPRAPRSRRGRSRRGAGLERRLPSAALRRDGRPDPRDRPGGERRGRCASAGSADARRVLRARDSAEPRGRGNVRELDRRATTSSRRFPSSTTSWTA